MLDFDTHGQHLCSNRHYPFRIHHIMIKFSVVCLPVVPLMCGPLTGAPEDAPRPPGRDHARWHCHDNTVGEGHHDKIGNCQC